jgi:chaperonin cofactor prefoldin
MDTGDTVNDLKAKLKQFTQPLVDSLDAKVRDQVDTRVDDRVDARLSVLERAIADLGRQVNELARRLDEHSNEAPGRDE